jgi:hypothetical protein
VGSFLWIIVDTQAVLASGEIDLGFVITTRQVGHSAIRSILCTGGPGTDRASLEISLAVVQTISVHVMDDVVGTCFGEETVHAHGDLGLTKANVADSVVLPSTVALFATPFEFGQVTVIVIIDENAPSVC